MRIIDELSSLRNEMNKNQKLFVKASAKSFEQIDPRFLDKRSIVEIKESTLYIKLNHRVDSETTLTMRVDKYEAYFFIAGIGQSLFFFFPKLNGFELFEACQDFILACLNGEYTKEILTDSSGVIRAAKLKWKNDMFQESTSSSIGWAIRNFLFKPQINSREFHYSSFLGIGPQNLNP